MSKLPPPLVAAFLLVALLAPCTGSRLHACPAICACSAGKIDCSGRGLVTLPGTPGTTLTLDLSKNALGPLINSSFTGRMPNLTRLDLSHNGLKRLLACTLTGMMGLRSLSLRGNLLEVIPDSLFADNDKLEELDLSENQLTSLPDFDFLRHLPNLKRLDVSSNRLNSLLLGPRFQVPRHIQFLDLSYNQFQRVSADAFQTATDWAVGVSRTLRLAHCGLQGIAPAALPKIPGLGGLDLSDNPGVKGAKVKRVIKALENSELEYLSLSGLGLTSLAPLFTDITVLALKHLDASNNSIEDLPDNALATVSSLRKLDLTGNSLTSVGAGFGQLVNLEVLNLSSNGLQAFNGAPVRLMSRLHTLTLANNRLSGDDSVDLSGLSELRHLVLHNNLLTAVPFPANTTGLETLDLRANSIAEFDSMDDAASLQHVDLSDNDLAALGPYLFKGAHLIKVANFSGNSLTRLDNRAFLPQSPLVLDLSHNFLTELHSPSWVATQTLDLGHNRLANLNVHTFYGMTGLMQLDLSSNKLTWLHEDLLEHLDAMTRLDLSKNQLGGQAKEGPREKIFWTRLFRNLALLRHLDLEHNNISSLPEDALRPLVSLRTLDLSHNKLATVFPRVFHDRLTLTSLDLAHNPFHCSCDLLAFRDWLSRTSTPILRLKANSSYTCHTPDSRLGLYITAWGPDEFECNEMTFYLIVFGAVGVFLILAVVLTVGLVRVYRRRRAKRNESRRRRARILRELEQVRKGKDTSDGDTRMLLVSKEVAAEIEEVLEAKSNKATRKHEDKEIRENGGAYVPWPVGRKSRRQEDERVHVSPTTTQDPAEERIRSRHAEFHPDRQPRTREAPPRIVRLDQHYPYILHEAVPVAERLDWAPRQHGYHHEDRYRYRPEPAVRRGPPPQWAMTYTRGSIDSTGRPEIWSTTNDYRPAHYWTLPGGRHREQPAYGVRVHQGYPGSRARGPGVRFEDAHHDDRYDYWQRRQRSMSQGYLPAADYDDHNKDDGDGAGDDHRQHRQYESIEQHQRRRSSGLGERAASQPHLAPSNTSGWL